VRLAYASPLPPVRSGVSEYSRDLLPHLKELAEVRLFAAPPATGLVAGLPVEVPEALAAGDVDVAIHHVGNNTHHRFAHELAQRVPGIVVLHDLVLHHYYIEETLGQGRPDEYVDLMREIYGEAGDAAALARVHESSSETDYFCFPLFERLAVGSRGIIVHNQRAARMVRERIVGLPVTVVPMGIPEASEDPLPERATARRDLGISPSSFVIGSFGFTTPIKRPMSALAAFARALDRLGDAHLVVVGEVTASLDLEAEARRLGIADRVILTGYVDYQSVKRWSAATDVFLNLRYPTAGETSASLLRLLGWGRTVIVSDFAQFRELPDHVVLRASVEDQREIPELAELMVLLAGDSSLRRGFGRRAAAHVAEKHTLEAAARAYVDFASEVVRRPASVGRMIPFGVRPTSRIPGRPRARIRAPRLPRIVPPGARIRLDIELENHGDTTWLRGPFPDGGYTVLAAELRRTDGTPVAELAWAGLPRDVLPGQTAKVTWSDGLPEVTGSFELLIDLKVAGWDWFHARGSEAIVFPLTITASV